MKYRSIAAADSSRNLPPRTSGMLSGQDVLSVPDMYWKIALQRAGLGVGYLPPFQAPVRSSSVAWSNHGSPTSTRVPSARSGG
ncbi:hypothetical protein [Sulfurifustis variabilis]|nr:hypothetical protein [Sulfurifustis variabilis]